MQIPDKCSFDWAKKLAEAGYPQPKYAPGQLWYDRFARPIIVASVFHSGVFLYTNIKTGQSGRVLDFHDGQIYAPGVEELMKQISFDGYYSPDIYYRIDGSRFALREDGETMDTGWKIEGASICDLLAEAWIENHKNLLKDEKE